MSSVLIRVPGESGRRSNLKYRTAGKTKNGSEEGGSKVCWVGIYSNSGW